MNRNRSKIKNKLKRVTCLCDEMDPQEIGMPGNKMNTVQGGQEKNFVNNHFIYRAQSEIIRAKYDFIIGNASPVPGVVMPDKKTILLVEDEDLLVILQTDRLERLGFNVIAVSSGERAIEVTQTTPGIDLILMDINLRSGMDGLEAASTILKDHDIPVVFLSSHEGEEIVKRTKEISSYGYVVKESDMTALGASVKTAMKLHEAHRVLKKKESS